MIDGGWIKLYRQILANGWLRNHKVLVFWIYCLLKAAYKPTKVIIGFKEIYLESGQFVFGRRRASGETALSEREIRTCLAFLVKAGNLTIKTTKRFSIITIINWEDYQNSEALIDPQNDQHTTTKRPHTRRIKNENKETSSDSPNPEVRKFLDFWCQTFKERFGEFYTVNGGKEGRLVKSLLENYSFDRLKELAETFFHSEDSFIQTAGYTIGVFRSQIIKLITQKNAGSSWDRWQPKGEEVKQ
jgi:hypothetical protein